MGAPRDETVTPAPAGQFSRPSSPTDARHLFQSIHCDTILQLCAIWFPTGLHERMRYLILQDAVSGILREAIAFVPCTALILTAMRVPVVRVRSLSLHLSSVVACAIALWVGPFAGIVGALLAALIEARLFHRERYSRACVLRSGLTLATAAGASSIVVAAAGPLPDPALPIAQFCLSSLIHYAPSIMTFLSVYSIGVLCMGSPINSRAGRSRQTFFRLRLGVTAAAFLPLVLVLPVGVVYGPWALLSLAGLLVLVGLLFRRAFEFSSLRRQLSVSQAMGLASLQDDSTPEPTALLYRFLHLADDLVHADRSLVWLVDDAHDEIVPMVGIPDMGEFAGLRTRFGVGLVGTAAERTRPLIVSDAARTQRRGEQEPAADSWLLYPIISQKKVLGVAHWTRPASNPFTVEDAAQLEGLVPHVGVAVESLRARNKVRDLAATDGLTGLFNHKRIDDLMREEMRRAQRYNRPLSVLMLDLDAFKSFNDHYGHLAGDDLLRNVAQILRASVRTVDRVGRYGGEEFIVVMPETHKDDAFLLAERIRGAVEEKGFIVVAGEEVHRTVSVGVASYPEDGLNPLEVVQRADEALYRAKDQGRNCVIWA